MSGELLNALISEQPMVKKLHKKIRKLEKRNMKLKVKKNTWKDKYHAIMAILHDYPGITYKGDITTSKRRRDVIDLTDDDESITLDVDTMSDLKNSIMDFTNSLSIVKTEHPQDLCKNEDCVGSDPDNNLSKCTLCDGYYNDDGLNDILFIEEEPNNRKASCDLCKKTADIVQMKGTGQYICQNACDDDEEEVEEEEEEVVEEGEEEEEEVVEEGEEEEEEAEEGEEEEVVEEEEGEEEEEEAEEGEEEEEEAEEGEEEEVVEEGEEEVVEEEEGEEEEEEEEEEAVYEVEIKGVTYYTTDEKNGEVYKITDDEDIGDCIGRFVNGKFKKNK